MLVSRPTLPARHLPSSIRNSRMLSGGFAVATPRQLAPSVGRTRAGSRYRRLQSSSTTAVRRRIDSFPIWIFYFGRIILQSSIAVPVPPRRDPSSRRALDRIWLAYLLQSAFKFIFNNRSHLAGHPQIRSCLACSAPASLWAKPAESSTIPYHPVREFSGRGGIQYFLGFCWYQQRSELDQS